MLSKKNPDIALREHVRDSVASTLVARVHETDPGHLYRVLIREIEIPALSAVMSFCHGNQSKAALVLGINRKTLRSKLEYYGLAD